MILLLLTPSDGVSPPTVVIPDGATAVVTVPDLPIAEVE